MVERPARLSKPTQPGLTLPGSNRPVIDIWIPSALLRGKGSDTHHVFQVYVRCGDDEWNVYVVGLQTPRGPLHAGRSTGVAFTRAAPRREGGVADLFFYIDVRSLLMDLLAFPQRYRRFTHFSDLHQQVTRIFGTNKIKLPRKKAFGKKSAKFVEERRKELENYIRQIIQLCLGQTRSLVTTLSLPSI